MSCYSGCTNLQMCICSQKPEKCRCEQILNEEKQKQLIAFSEQMERQMKSLAEQKDTEIDELTSKIQEMKMKTLKLEHRNKLDRENELKLNEKVRYLQDIVDQYKRKCNQRQIQTKQVIRQVIVEKEVGVPLFDEQLARLRKQNKQIREKLVLKEQSLRILEEENDRDKRLLNSEIEKIQIQLDNVKDLLRNKNKENQQLKRDILFLQEKIEIINKPSERQFTPLVLNRKQIAQPAVQTVYIEKPIEKTVFIEVEKKIKEFIQPERPVVNRIINCPDKKSCKCEEQPLQSNNFEEDYETVYNQYENVISSYKNERQKLVSVIKSKDSDINLLEKQLNILSYRPTRDRCQNGSDVQVTVTRDEERIKKVPTESKSQIKKTNVPMTKTGKKH